jgi:hypothetical protein
MRHSLRCLIIVVVVLGLTAAAVTAQERRSGTIESVDAQARSFVFTELAEDGRRRTLRVQTGGDTRITLSERLPEGQATADRPFKDTPISVADLRPGDFVVVEMAPDGGQPRVRSVTVTLREGAR